MTKHRNMVNVVTWTGTGVRHVARHGSSYTFCGAELLLQNHRTSFPLHKTKADVPTCIICVGRFMCRSR